MLSKKDKGEYGYLRYKKTILILFLIGIIMVSIGIFVLGLLLNKMESRNIFTVASILGVLPAAKMITLLVVVLPNREIDREERDFIDTLMKRDDIVLYDVVFTSSERPMHLDAVVLTGHQLIGLSTQKRDKLDKTEEYFKHEFEIRKLDYVCFLTDSKDTFKNRFKLRSDAEELTEAQAATRNNVLDFFRAAIV